MNKALYVFCEGRTEQNFCRQVLQPTFFPHYDGEVRALLIAHSRRHGVIHRGGVNKYINLKHDIHNTLKEHDRPGVFFTSMIDLYGLPGDFPGKSDHKRSADHPRPYVEALELAFGKDIGDSRFTPHLQLHEYETLLFADVESFKCAFDDCEVAVERLRRIVHSFTTVEHINESPQTAPSKRIIDILPSYDGLKQTAGPDIAEFTGVERLSKSCPDFGDWITTIKSVLAQ